MGCGGKKRYSTEKIASDYASFHNKSPFVKEKDIIRPYFCAIHDGWHVGHSKQLEEMTPTERLNTLFDQIRMDT